MVCLDRSNSSNITDLRKNRFSQWHTASLEGLHCGIHHGKRTCEKDALCKKKVKKRKNACSSHIHLSSLLHAVAFFRIYFLNDG